VRNVKPELGVR